MTHPERQHTVGIDLRDVYEQSLENGRRIAEMHRKVDVLAAKVDQRVLPEVADLEAEVETLSRWKKAVPASLLAALGTAAGWLADALEIIHIS